MSDIPVSPLTNTQMDPSEGNLASSADLSSLNTSASVLLIPLEDCKCPICLDYFIDIVETRCHHRFCNFCLENWLRVSLYRHCPTCRSLIQGSLQVKPDLQQLIDTSINHVLSEDMIRERLQIRSQRQAQVTRFSADREQTQALLARISTSRHRTRNFRRGRRFADAENEARETTGNSFISRHILNWWDENHNNNNDTNNIVTPEVNSDDPAIRLAEVARLEEEVESNIMDLGWVRRVRDLHLQEHLNTLSGATQEAINPSSPHADRNIRIQVSSGGRQRESQRGRATIQFDQSYHENLMEEYNYHLRRVNSAHTRIREAYRDFNYHNGRMQEILQEHRSFFSTRESPELGSSNRSNNESIPISYANLIGLEIEELLNNSAATEVALRGLATVNALEPNELSPQNMHPFTFDGEISSDNNYAHRHVQVNSRRIIAPGPLPYQRTNVLDMEQEIRNRRNQLNRLSSLMRQGPYSRNNNLSNNGPSITSNSPTPLSTPLQFAQPQLDTSARHNWARRSTGQHQIMVERLTGVNNALSTLTRPYLQSSRRNGRRRMGRTNLFRTNNDDTGRTNNVVASNERPCLPTHNLHSTNAASAATVACREANVSSNNNTGTSRDTSFLNSLSNGATVSNNSNDASQLERESNRVLPNSTGWIAESTESEEDDQTREIARQLPRTSIPLPHRNSTQKTTPAVVPPQPPPHRNVRRAIRSQQQRQFPTTSSETNGGGGLTAMSPASLSSDTSSSTVSNNLSSITNALMNSDEEELDRVMDTDNDSLFVESENLQSPERTSAEEDESVLDALNDMASVSTYLRSLCDTFKSR